MEHQRKYIFITGGVISGLGKGCITSVIGFLFKAQRYKVTAIKIDPYINIDAGLFSPYEHGEVFVLDDGSEVDQDLGSYERFLGVRLTGDHNITTGKIFQSVINKERAGKYLGKTVQIIPHITTEIKDWILRVSERDGAEIVLVEIGGTVGDIESMPFLEAARQLRNEKSSKNVLFIHVTLVPELKVMGEQKTKPTQHSVKQLLELGIQPDVIICRAERKISMDIKKKIALFCNVPIEGVISDPTTKNLYELILIFGKEKVINFLSRKLCLKERDFDLKKLKRQFKPFFSKKGKLVNVAIVGKYTKLKDSYKSILEALSHASGKLGVRLKIHWIETTNLFDYRVFSGIDGILVPGGFGSRGIEGKIMAIKYARENNIPFLGLCLGFQLAVIEYARNVCKLKNAHSTEIDPNTPHPIIDYIPTQRDITKLGGTMRLGAHKTYLEEGSLVNKLYGQLVIEERHRHRYEVNPKYIPILTQGKLLFTGRSKEGVVEFLELIDHIFFVGTQAHPEFKSRLDRPSPLFLGFIRACLKVSNRKQ